MREAELELQKQHEEEEKRQKEQEETQRQIKQAELELQQLKADQQLQAEKDQLLDKVDKVLSFVDSMVIKNDFDRELASMREMIAEQKSLISDLVSATQPQQDPKSVFNKEQKTFISTVEDTANDILSDPKAKQVIGFVEETFDLPKSEPTQNIDAIKDEVNDFLDKYTTKTSSKAQKSRQRVQLRGSR
ncbi:hypothetical protein FGO68_gene4318 [Halteria grandinella]|uniref:Uncharacterized protein n=1 Tax=Halteria grandinella TaxID=5974 RepID=A0A8J8SVL2_HALGN|nr:hypothetical protein FGO68_gene4318 [Halteria grandinella]